MMMISKKTASLTSDLIVKKGEALPSTSVDKVSNFSKEYSFPLPGKNNGTIAVTVRLDPFRYEQLKLYGAHNRLTNQNIIIEALDQYFSDKIK